MRRGNFRQKLSFRKGKSGICQFWIKRDTLRESSWVTDLGLERLTSFALKQVNSQLVVMPDVLSVTESEARFSDGKVATLDDQSLLSCSCSFWYQWLLPCRHMVKWGQMASWKCSIEKQFRRWSMPVDAASIPPKDLPTEANCQIKEVNLNKSKITCTRDVLGNLGVVLNRVGASQYQDAIRQLKELTDTLSGQPGQWSLDGMEEQENIGALEQQPSTSACSVVTSDSFPQYRPIAPKPSQNANPREDILADIPKRERKRPVTVKHVPTPPMSKRKPLPLHRIVADVDLDRDFEDDEPTVFLKDTAIRNIKTRFGSVWKRRPTTKGQTCLEMDADEKADVCLICNDYNFADQDNFEWIQCDHCDHWYHMGCLSTFANEEKQSGNFRCVWCNRTSSIN